MNNGDERRVADRIINEVRISQPLGTMEWE
jgi:hypothetical protein